MTDTEDRLPLSALPREIANVIGGKPPKYRDLYNAAINCVIPADRGPNGRWTVVRRDVPRIAKIVRDLTAAA